ncbi:MAG: hypothetical protein HN764_14965 [Gammaproteobacteria bacterium]|jgi:hypothetical protein|nr:hypothetical protein [Gammaproteobacteria bacterium]
MYVVSIRYPRKNGKEFDFGHWAEVHMPLGIATFKKANGIAPKRVMVQHETFGMDGESESTDAYITVWLLFDTRKGLDGFMKLHNDKVASAELSDDFDNYAPLPPHISLGQLRIFENMNDVLEKGNALLNN